MSNTNNKTIDNTLIQSSYSLENSLRVFKEINQRAQFIALSASIEGARMKGKLSTFSIVADQIAKQASQNDELSEKLAALIAQIKVFAQDAAAVRNLELSADLIDMLDRNLFERNCDVQAWAGFDVVKKALLEPGETSTQGASEQLEKLVTIYCVYLDSILVDLQGNAVAVARRQELLGTSFKNSLWFENAIKGEIVVSDGHTCPTLKANTVYYCAPIYDADGKIIGALANCFDWNYALEMIKSANYSDTVKAVIINRNANVIASKFAPQIMNDSYLCFKAGELATTQQCGYSLEYARNGEAMAVGFYHTKGYNSYKGKGWSAVISESVGDVRIPIHAVVTEQRDTTPAAVAPSDNKVIESEKSGKELLRTMKDLDALVHEINANNREVKFLAVNASIQAGLAGTEGEGFSIIANEVAGLAKKSLNFVENMNATTERLRHSVEHSSAVRLLDAAKDSINKIDRNLFERYCDIQAWSTFSKFIETL